MRKMKVILKSFISLLDEECDSTPGCSSICVCYASLIASDGQCAEPTIEKRYVNPEFISSLRITILPSCGDGILSSPENCDSGIGCDETCQCSAGYESQDSIDCMKIITQGME